MPQQTAQLSYDLTARLHGECQDAPPKMVPVNYERPISNTVAQATKREGTMRRKT